jgi:geranylgeranyl pyrophosphate synthase
VDDLELEHIIQSVRTSSAVDLAIQEAERFTQQAEVLLSHMPAKPEREALIEIARYVVRRDL